MDLRQLRESTRPEHEATEAFMPVMGPDLDLALYTRVLQVLLPLIRGWERWAANVAPADIQPLLADRRRGHLLEADLATLGATQEIAPAHEVDWLTVISGSPCSDGRVLEGQEFHAAFLGCLYVMEGSTLGGRYIARHVETALPLEPGQGNAYFQGHGEETGAMWRQVTACLAAVPEPQAEIVTAAARRTFTAFGDVLRAGLASRAVHG